jgi:alanyl-tRNA synthetase
MQSHEIRKCFLQFFADRGHQVVPSSSLIPANDPTLFFTNAGMVQFKDTFIGLESRACNRAASAQKCLRVSGKHNDLENVGRTPRHHTLFEMLGNFSFGDYFKTEAIQFHWEFLTKELEIDPDRLWVSVYEEDDEAYKIWRDLGVIPEERIQRLGASENFWSMGETGPCGPCSEIHYDHGPEYGPPGGPASESPRYVEICNLVFMQFDRDASGKMNPLPRPSIDTGSGLERLAAVVQGVYSNYDTDCFQTLLQRISELAGVPYGQETEQDVAMRVIADHARATAFLVSDGVMPSNEERGYVLRRIMRRAIRNGVKLGFEGSFLWKVADAVVEQMSEAFPELEQRRDFIREVVRVEEERFSETLDKGLALLNRAFEQMESAGEKALPGDVAFKLYDTFGFPLDLTELIAEERGLSIDVDGYHAAMEAQKAAGRAAWKGSGEASLEAAWFELRRQGLRTEFSGYSLDTQGAEVTGLVHDGASVQTLTKGQTGSILTQQTPFYAESGGQVGDTGIIRWEGGEARVLDTASPVDGLVAHRVEVVSGTLETGREVELEVDTSRRDRTRLNHTATHLLHAALREVLGEHVTQKGSLVDPVRLRFDYAHHKATEPEELERIERMVYTQILGNALVQTEECSMDEARERGAMALFGEKYGAEVRVVSIPGFSTELCGGTHARYTGDIGLFRITGESGIAAGVRRIEAVTGPEALRWVRKRDQALTEACSQLRTAPDGLAESIQRIVEDRKRLERELDKVKRELARAQAGDLASQARDVNGVKVLAAEFGGDAGSLRDEADRLRDQLGSAVVVLGTRSEDSVKLVITVSKDLAGSRFHAGKLIKAVAAQVGGGGGGRPDMAQAGGRNPAALPEALESVYSLVQQG